MGALLLALSPFIIGSALVPVQIIIAILLLKSPHHGALKASAYVAGMTTTRLLQGLVFGLLLTESVEATAEGGKSPIVSTVLLLLGILLLISAYKKWRKEADPDDPPPAWLAKIDGLTPAKAFGIGFGMLLLGPKFWVFTLGAIGVIAEAQLGQPASTIAYLLFVLLAQSLLIFSILIKVVLPEQSRSWLDQFSAWMTRNNRPILITVSLVFGLFFLYKGLSGLMFV